MKFGARADGVQRVLTAGRKTREGDARRVEDVLPECGQMIIDAAGPLIPVQFGDLKATGRVDSQGKGLATQVAVTYGGVSRSGRLVDYAVYVHEDLTKRHAPPTGAKFLTKAVNRVRGSMTAKLRRQLRVGGA